MYLPKGYVDLRELSGVPSTPPAGQHRLYVRTDQQLHRMGSDGIETLVEDHATNDISIANMPYESWRRNGHSSGTTTLTSGALYLVAVSIPADTPIGRLGFFSIGAAATPTHSWFGLYDQNRVQLATTADQLTAAWAANTWKSLAVATTAAGASTSFKTTYRGLHYIGCLVTATTMPTLASVSSVVALLNTAPMLTGGSASTGLTTPSTFPFTAGAMLNAAGITLPYAAAGP